MDLFELGHEIKKLRQQKKWSQDTMEQYSGITKRTISKIENGFIEEVGIRKVGTILDLLDMELSLCPKGRPRTLEELQDERE
jgi:transcriptional regulator with XRE-family HTH domain